MPALMADTHQTAQQTVVCRLADGSHANALKKRYTAKKQTEQPLSASNPHQPVQNGLGFKGTHEAISPTAAPQQHIQQKLTRLPIRKRAEAAHMHRNNSGSIHSFFRNLLHNTPTTHARSTIALQQRLATTAPWAKHAIYYNAMASRLHLATIRKLRYYSAVQRSRCV